MSVPGIRPVVRWLKRHPAIFRMAVRATPDWRRRIDVGPIGPFDIRLRRHRKFWLHGAFGDEAFPLGVLRSLVRPGDTVLDVGANVGLYARMFAGPFRAGRVYSFEPMSDNLDDLRRNVALAPAGSAEITVMPFALSDQDGPAALQVDDLMSASAALDSVNQGRAAYGRRSLGLAPKTETVECRRLDTLLADGAVPPPGVLKVDVEGAEGMVLRGGERTIDDHAPRIVVELHGPEPARDVVGWLLDHGYHVAGAVSERIDPARFARLDRGVIDRIEGPYDVHFVAASRDDGDLPDRFEPYVPAPRP